MVGHSPAIYVLGIDIKHEAGKTMCTYDVGAFFISFSFLFTLKLYSYDS